MKRGLYLLVFVLLFPFVSAGEGWMHSSGEIEMSLDISSTITITKQTGTASVDTVSANLSFIPREDEQQKVVSVTYDPRAKLLDGAALYTWNKPSGLTFDYGFTSTLRNTNRIAEIRAKVPFPLKDPGKEYSQYLAPQDVIDSDDPEINKAASAIVDGETDLFIAAGKLAVFVMDSVEYKGDDPTVASGTREASWVLRNRIGVCDEMTGLFMALARSVGIPARYVSGLAYTNLNDMDDWGPHAWAEIYFPGTGWVPYDVTYGELGFVDATHIKLQESLDADESSTSYSWRGRNIDLTAEELTMEVERIGIRGAFDPPVRLTVSVIKEKTGFGSWNAVEVEVENRRPYYVATEITLSRTLEVEMEDGDGYVLLPPNAKKNLYFMIKLSDDLDSSYIYTIPTVAYSTRNASSATSFQAQARSTEYSRQDIERILSGLREEEEKEYSKELSIACSPEKDGFYVGVEIAYTCVLENQGNIALNMLSVCLEGDCQGMTLGIGQEGTAVFRKSYDTPGEKDLIVTAKNALVSRQSVGTVTVFDEPAVSVIEISFPETIKYNEESEIGFLLTKASSSIPRETKVTVSWDGYSKEWDVGDMETDQRFIVKVTGKHFREGANTVTMAATYTDERGKSYSTEEKATVTLTGLTFFQKIGLMMYKLEDWLMGSIG